MSSLAEYSASLGPLETFDPAAFRGGERTSQEVCNFVLALALIHNDYKNLVLAHALLDGAQPEDPTKITADRGEHAGLKVHVIRLHASLVHELCRLIHANIDLVTGTEFTWIIKRLDERAREKWQALVDAAEAKPSENQFTKALLLLRNKAAYHYDPEEIARGYEHVVGTLGMTPYVSRGLTLRNTRFYFADAAAQGYLNVRVGEEGLKPFLDSTARLLESLNIALSQIVERFIQGRGFAWRAKPPSA
jgi:hypothetical protein